jgi:hypothetical protein
MFERVAMKGSSRSLVVSGLPLVSGMSVLVLLAAACSREKPAEQAAATPPVNVTINWDKVITVSKTTPTLQVVVNPPLRRGSKIHDPV